MDRPTEEHRPVVVPDDVKYWTVRDGLGLFWVYNGNLHVLVPPEKSPGYLRWDVPLPKIPRPARDILRALLQYSLDMLDKEEAEE